MKLNYQTLDSGLPLWRLCASAAIGAAYESIDVYPFVGFEGVEKIKDDKKSIIVGSVEVTSLWLDINGYDIPKPIDQKIITSGDYQRFYKRSIDVLTKDQVIKLKDPKFIKPYDTIKAFTGFVFNPKNANEIDFHLNGYNGLFQVQQPIEVISEYRTFITKGKLVGLKYYAGDFLKHPDEKFVKMCVEEIRLDTDTFTIDFGITSKDETVVVELNDAWAISDYGLDERLYFSFLKNRWFQILNQK